MKNSNFFSVEDVEDKRKEDELLAYLLDLEEVKFNVESKPRIERL